MQKYILRYINGLSLYSIIRQSKDCDDILFLVISNNCNGEKKVTTEEIGKNVKVDIDGNILTITIDLTKTFGKSGSGKSTIIATTSGNKGIGKEDIKLGLNCYTPVKND